MRDRLAIQADHDGAVWIERRRVGTSPRSAWYRHTHDELEANLVVSGHATYVIGEQRIRITRGVLVWLFPQQEHQLHDLSTDYRHTIAVWRQPLVRSVARAFAAPAMAAGNPSGTWARELAGDEVHALEAVLADVAHQAEADLINAGLRYLLLRLWRAFQAASPIAHQHPAVAAAFTALRDDALDAESLARHVGMSADHLRRLVRTTTGTTLVATRQRHQLERFFALYDPHTGMLPTALSAGFGSYAQFSRVFRRLVGCGPRTWQQRLAVGDVDRFPQLIADAPRSRSR